MTDLTFHMGNNRFNYRVGAIILHDNHILAMKDERDAYYYLPGGRVKLHESSQEAVLREMKEELQIEATIVRPLWYCENFFTEDLTGELFHEIGVYYLIDATNTNLLTRGSEFVGHEEGHKQCFEWLPIDNLKDTYLYPLFIKDKIQHLPTSLEMIVERK